LCVNDKKVVARNLRGACAFFKKLRALYAFAFQTGANERWLKVPLVLELFPMGC